MQIKKRTLKISFIILIILLLIYFLIPILSKEKPIYGMHGNKMFYSQDREKPEVKFLSTSVNDSITLARVSFPSRNFLKYNTTIYGLLFTPYSKKLLPGVLVLPGGGVSKESWISRATFIAKQGYVVLVIDQRGIGETGGYYLSFEDDYKVFMQGNEPVQHLSVYDALVSLDTLSSFPSVQKDNLAILGESMGGRYALIATSMDKRVKGVITISSSGFNLSSPTNDSSSIFMHSIDPDNYIADISPRKLFMLQGTNDSVTPFPIAQNTFQKARDPKSFFTAQGCGHGYCDKMEDTMLDALKSITS